MNPSIYTIQCLHCSQTLSTEPGTMDVPLHYLPDKQHWVCPGSGQFGLLLDKRTA